MKVNLKVKQLVGVGSIIGGISVGTLFTVNKDLRHQLGVLVTEGITVHDTVDAHDPELSAEVQLGVERALDDAVEELLEELGGIEAQVEDVDEALGLLDDRHDLLAERVDALAFFDRRPLVYVVIDSILTPVDPDTVKGIGGWLRMLFPPDVPPTAIPEGGR